MIASAAPESVAAAPSPIRTRGYWRRAGGELLHDPSAVIGLVIVCALTLAALLAPVLAPADPAFQARDGLSLEGDPLGPSAAFPLGTDPLGRDVASRLLYGARVSLAVGIGANLIATTFALLMGGTAGMAGRGLQTALMRVVDVVLSFPILLAAIALLAVAQPGVLTISVIIGIGFGAYLARIVFTQVVSLREREFVLAARAAGVSPAWILLRHIVPHVLPSIIVFVTLGIATAIQLEAALSFVGIGIQPPDASWGNMISEGQSYLRISPALVAFPGLAIVLAMLGFGLLGDGLRDALDPTLERRANLHGLGVR